MAARVLAQVLMVGGQVLGRAAMQAYRQALANGKAGGVTSALRNTMDIQQARMVLNVEETATKEAIMKSFEYHHGQNAATDTGGGSPFLQAKITNAKEALLQELGEKEGKPDESAAGSGEEGKNEEATEEKRQ